MATREKMTKGLTIAIVAMAVVGLTVGSANAAQIYFDDFSGSAAAGLHGTKPDISATGASWVARSTYKADGSFTWENGAAMSLAFTPVDGHVYTLDVKIDHLTGAHWVQFGFGNGQDPGWTARVWHLLRVAEQTTAAHARYFDGWDSGGAAWSALALLKYAEPLHARIILDTTGGTGSWQATWYGKADGDPDYTEVAATATLTKEDINSVGIDVFNTVKTGKLLSFSLSDDSSATATGTVITVR